MVSGEEGREEDEKRADIWFDARRRRQVMRIEIMWKNGSNVVVCLTRNKRGEVDSPVT
jgi:hypothetical protein